MLQSTSAHHPASPSIITPLAAAAGLAAGGRAGRRRRRRKPGGPGLVLLGLFHQRLELLALLGGEDLVEVLDELLAQLHRLFAVALAAGRLRLLTLLGKLGDHVLDLLLLVGGQVELLEQLHSDRRAGLVVLAALLLRAGLDAAAGRA